MPGVPIKYVDEVWDLAAPMLQKALDKMPGVYSMDDIKSKCLDGTYVLWFFEKAKCALIVKILQCYSYKACVIMLAGGEDMDAWIAEVEDIEKYARSQGCKEILITGREGWRRIFKDYMLDSVTIKKEL